jgi:hypothetical protein
VSLLASLSSDAREELRAFVQSEVRREMRAADRLAAQREWLTTEETAALVGTTENAIRCRLRRGWLAGDVARDGKRLLVRRAAVLDWLDGRAG